ncbi:hypothetical protein DM02DRAFT_618493 [Periconia macrospinosa]|uniref:Uncharacterized protein n=1 Tax=Periconia macrospinosa TaxID=97972 RepID=A0A2V1D974_9PLEO|nr:hypothetical protein DM02DRAFT_618493 [Periconia macrospinosa]
MLRNDRATDYNVAPEDQLLPEVMLGLKFDFSSATDTSDQEGAESEKENARSGQRSTNLPPTPPLTPLDSPPRTSPSDGFVFYQLGRLEYYPSTTADLEQEELISEDWVDSGFVVVIQVLSNGMKGGIYLIHNHNKICDCGDRHNKSGDTLGGVLPTKYDFLSESDSEYDNDEEDELLDTRIYGAFIAAKFEDLVHGKELQVKPFTRKIKEFTRVVKTSNGVYTRQGDKHRAQSTARNSNATSVL